MERRIQKLRELFTKNLTLRQRQYEAVRAVAFQEGTIEEIAKRYQYSPGSLQVLVSNVLTGQHILFPEVKRGPKARRVTTQIEKIICKLRRKKRLSGKDIAEELNKDNISVGVRTIERVLTDAGFPRLRRRSDQERGVSKNGSVLPIRSEDIDIASLQKFRHECQVAGVFFFIPYIIESGIMDIVEKIPLPASNDIGAKQAGLSVLLLKLIGKERLSHIGQYNMDRGFGIFAGLNFLPKPTYISNYSCRLNARDMLRFQQEIVKNFLHHYPDIYESNTINLDFHSIPHFGNQSQMEKVWCGSRNKTMKGANTFFAQIGGSDALVYSRSDIKRKEASEEIEKFVDFWIEMKGAVEETLVLDSKITRYEILEEMNIRGIKFITIRRRSDSLTQKTNKIPEKEWKKAYLNVPKRKYKHIKVYESKISLTKDSNQLFRQIILKDHGRIEPTYLVTNNWELKMEEVVKAYGKRWHIENTFSELVKFFNLNSLSSPVMVRIHFDILWTIIADTLYRLFAQDLPRFEKAYAPRIFRNFVDMPGVVEYDGKEFRIKIRKRAYTPVLLGVERLTQPVRIPWLGDRLLKIIWTA